MKNFDLIFNCMFFAVLIYQVLYFLVQYAVLKRIELVYYSMFLLTLSVYYYVYVLLVILNSNSRPSLKLGLSSLELVFLFSINLFYMQFLTNYLELQKTKRWIYYVTKYYNYYNIFFMLFFFTLSVLKIENNSFFAIASLLCMPVNLLVMVMVWRINSTYSKVIVYGITCAVIGELVCHILILKGIDTYTLYNGNAYVPVQIGVLADVFILGYGLSLKAAESDKKLVKILLENQQIVEVERSRLAKDLHDGLGGLLSGIKLTLHSISDAIPQKIAPAFSKVINQLDTVIKEMRRVAHNMMPEALLKFGLGEAIQDYCDGINESNIIKIKYTQIGSLQTLTQSTAIVLYRIIQELTNNSIKHAAAKNIFIQITKHQEGYTITVEDDGKGFDTKAMPDVKGNGLKNVKSRVEYLKGGFTADSEQDKGTSMIVEIPNHN